MLLLNFLALLTNFYFCKGYWALDYVCFQFCDLAKIFSFSKLFDNSRDNSYIQFEIIII